MQLSSVRRLSFASAFKFASAATDSFASISASDSSDARRASIGSESSVSSAGNFGLRSWPSVRLASFGSAVSWAAPMCVTPVCQVRKPLSPLSCATDSIDLSLNFIEPPTVNDSNPGSSASAGSVAPVKSFPGWKNDRLFSFLKRVSVRTPSSVPLKPFVPRFSKSGKSPSAANVASLQPRPRLTCLSCGSCFSRAKSSAVNFVQSRNDTPVTTPFVSVNSAPFAFNAATMSVAASAAFTGMTRTSR